MNNRGAVSISFSPLPFVIETRLFLVMILFFLSGLFFGLLACSQNLLGAFFGRFSDRKKIEKLEKKLSKN